MAYENGVKHMYYIFWDAAWCYLKTAGVFANSRILEIEAEDCTVPSEPNLEPSNLYCL